jgi:PAS domain S-box-containing protein
MAEDTQRLIGLTLLGEAIECLEGVAVFVWNDERRYVAVNEEACRLVGLERHELIGMPVGALTPDGAEPQMASVRGQGPVEGSHSITRPDGETVQLSWTTAPTRIAGLPYLVSVCRRVV